MTGKLGRYLVLFCSLWMLLSGNKEARVRHYEKREGFLHRLKTDVTFRAAFKEHMKASDHLPQPQATPAPPSITLNCNITRSITPPESAHRVRPSDIRVVAALGDSITAGMGITATNVIELLKDDRERTFSMGGYQSLAQGMMTLPNVLKHFNPQLTGFSFGEGGPDSAQAGLNSAVVGAETNEMREQAEHLVQKMRDPGKGVNWDDDWKLITVLIGANDLCQYCHDEGYFSPDAYQGHLREALDFLHTGERIPRTIIQLHTMFDITALPAFSDSFECDLIQGFVCDCATEPEHRPKMRQAQQAYHNKVVELVNTGRYDSREDFTVVVQPHLRNSTPPTNPEDGRVDKSFWAIDCFHPGQKAHWAIATSLWHQMLEPVGAKRESMDWSIGGNLRCPTQEHPYIFTRGNSQPGFQ